MNEHQPMSTPTSQNAPTQDPPTQPADSHRPDVWARVRPLVFRTIIGAVIAAGLVGVVAVLIGDFGTVGLQLLLMILVVVVFALLSWYDADVSSRRSSTFALASVVTSMYLLVVGLVKIWILRPDSISARYEDPIWTIGTQFWQWIGLVVVARAALLLVHLLLNIHRRFRKPVLQVVAKVTVGLIALLAALVSIPLLFPNTHFGESFWRLLWVVAILVVLGTVLVPLSNALFGPRPTWPQGGTVDPRYVPTPLYVGTQSAATPQDVATPPIAWQPGEHDRTGGPTSVRPSTPVGHGWGATPAPNPSATRQDPSAPSATSSGRASDDHRYEPEPPRLRVLAWPRYVDGTPLPAGPDGSPDFSGVEHR
ncbi:hypothetical protein [Curtobacterium sp. Leaf261]|uniref:hypothetical protein n=1 Tax=Curtobacterium sp. Leaf261 TaxID=1736311 RepID=UPI0006F8BBC0|nr:hypothetical protein [Curtobacterium sp. Leaf261]KQO60336.1 hypothetical protein ASF23_14005 [Curtobacterium sp. Leaf261]